MRRHLNGLDRVQGTKRVGISTDLVETTQQIKEFAGKFKDNIAIAGGVFEGKYKDAAEMTEIASIPALPVLRGMFVNVINSPIQGLVLGLNAIADKKS